MNFANTINSYSAFSRILHLAMACMMIGLLLVGFYMTSLESSMVKWDIYKIHKSFGVIMLLLAVIRILNKVLNTTPDLPPLPSWQTILAKCNIIVLYLLIFIMPFSGFIGSIFGGYDISFFNLFTIPSVTKVENISYIMHEVHEICAKVLIASISLHLFGGLYHHFILKDNTMRRMFACTKSVVDN